MDALRVGDHARVELAVDPEHSIHDPGAVCVNHRQHLLTCRICAVPDGRDIALPVDILKMQF
jgi:hypothetical protein